MWDTTLPVDESVPLDNGSTHYISQDGNQDGSVPAHRRVQVAHYAAGIIVVALVLLWLLGAVAFPRHNHG